VDCVIQEVDNTGVELWEWRASAHIGLNEELLAAIPPGINAVDLYHCNSIDVDPTSGDVLVSVRNTSAVYRISKVSKRILWKLGGNSTVKDGEKQLAVKSDPEGSISGQHDARFRSDPSNSALYDVSLYDDHTAAQGAARGVEYEIDDLLTTTIWTATEVWQYAEPNGQKAIGTGSFRRYGNDNVIGWGFLCGPPTWCGSGFTEVDDNKNVMLDVRFPNGELEYRVVKEDPGQFDVQQLRANAGVGWETMGGILATTPAASTWGPGRLDSFMSGTDGALWHNWRDDKGWHWDSLGGAPNSIASAVSWGTGRIDVFARFKDGALWHNFLAAGSWHGWESLGGILAGEPAAVSVETESLDVFVRGNDNQLWRDSYRTTNPGTGWLWTGLGGVLAAEPSAAAPGSGEVDAFVEGTDSALWQWSTNGGWQASRGGQLLGKPAVTTWGSGRLDVLVEGTDRALWHWSNAGGWDGQAVGGILAAPPVAITGENPRVDAFVEGTDSGVWHAWYDGTRWQWEGLNGALNGPPVAVTWGGSRWDTFARASADHSLIHLASS
jgi:hypothetical protein